MNSLQFRAMNSDILLVAEGEPERVAAGFLAARELIIEYERRFTRFSETSELAQLNRACGRWFQASAELFDVIQTALQYVDSTGGLFDPSILGALKRAGYDRSMDEIRLRDAGSESQAAVSDKTGIQEVRLDAKGCRIWLPPGMGLDLGGIAKGWIAELAAHRLNRYTPVCAVNAGGDLFLCGLPEGEAAWEIDLEDPREPSLSLGVLRVGEGALATSSVAKRRWRQGEHERHHLIDPRTGEPASTLWLSVTVHALEAAQAEVLAKALLIAGPQEAVRLAARFPKAAFLAVDPHGKLWGSERSMEFYHAG